MCEKSYKYFLLCELSLKCRSLWAALLVASFPPLSWLQSNPRRTLPTSPSPAPSPGQVVCQSVCNHDAQAVRQAGTQRVTPKLTFKTPKCAIYHFLTRHRGRGKDIRRQRKGRGRGGRVVTDGFTVCDADKSCPCPCPCSCSSVRPTAINRLE